MPPRPGRAIPPQLETRSTVMTRRNLLAAVLLPLLPARVRAAPSVSTLIGTGDPGYSDHAGQQSVRPGDRAGWRAVFLRSRQSADPAARSATRRTTTIAGSGERATRATAGRPRRRVAEHAARNSVRRRRPPLHRRARQPRRAQGRRRDRRHLDGGRHRHAGILRRRRSRQPGRSCVSRTASWSTPDAAAAHLRRRQPSHPRGRSR